MTPTAAQTVRELIEAAKDALDETVDARTYPDGPCMNKETRDALRTAYRAAEALLASEAKPIPGTVEYDDETELIQEAADAMGRLPKYKLGESTS